MLTSRTSRVALVLAGLAVTAVATSCTTISDRDTIARVGDVRLDRDEFDDLLVAASGATDGPVSVERSNVNSLLNGWIVTEVLAAEIARAGVAVTTTDIDEARQQLEAQFGQEWSLTTPAVLRDLQIRQFAVINAWEAIDDPAAAVADLEQAYALGPRRSSLTCSAHILVETEDEAAALIADLRAGDDFATLAGENSLDPGSAGVGGFLGCQGTAEFSASIVPEFAEAVLAGSVGEIIGPVETGFGHHVIWIPPLDGLNGDVRRALATLASDPQIRFRLAATTADVVIDPRYGVFDPNRGVTVLG